MLRKLLVALTQGCYRLSTLGLTKRYSFVRHSMYVRLNELCRPLLPRTGAVLSISNSNLLSDVIGLENPTITEANYPAVSMLRLPYADNTFDWVVSDQVLEHIQGDPQVAIDEVLRVLKPGGYMVHTTCFLIPYHGPGDYWRYSPEGLAHLCRGTSRIVEASGWGNPFVSFFTFLGFDFALIPLTRWHPVTWCATYRWPSYDYVVWVVAQK